MIISLGECSVPVSGFYFVLGVGKLVKSFSDRGCAADAGSCLCAAAAFYSLR